MKVIAIIGSTASGKDSLFKHMVNDNDVVPIVSTTTRPMRVSETQGVEYNFITYEEAEEMCLNNEFIEDRFYTIADGGTWFYGISKSSVDLDSDKTYGVIIDGQGLEQLKKYVDENSFDSEVISIFVDCPAQKRMQRALSREGSMTDEQVNELCRRNIADYKEVLPYINKVDYVISNEDMSEFCKNIDFLEELINKLKKDGK